MDCVSRCIHCGIASEPKVWAASPSPIRATQTSFAPCRVRRGRNVQPVCVWVNVLWKCVIYIIDVDVYDMWQKFKDLPWRLARSEQALRNHFSLRNRPGGYIPIFANVLSTVSNCWTWSILNMYMRIDIYVPGAGSPPSSPIPGHGSPNPYVGVGWGGRPFFVQCVHFVPPSPLAWVGVGRGLYMLYGNIE